MVNIEIQQARLNAVHKKIAQKLINSLSLSEWMCDRAYPWIQASFIDFRLDIDLHKTENMTDREIHELICTKIIINLETALGELTV